MMHTMPINPNSIISLISLVFIFTSLIIIVKHYYRAKKYEAEKYSHDYGEMIGRLEDFVDLFEDLKDRGYDYNARISSLENDFIELKTDIEIFKMSHIITGGVSDDKHMD